MVRIAVSFFDGMSCGQVALERAGISVKEYYSFEIDKPAITVTQANYPNTKQMGDINDWRSCAIDWSKVDLLLAGSPCQGLSLAGKQLAFDDPRSKLFFVFMDILNHARTVNPDIKFLLENVKMKTIDRDLITQHIGVDPMFINSADLSAQNRQRYYWFNWSVEDPIDRSITLTDILEEKYSDDVLGCAMRGRYDLDGKVVQKIELRKDLKANCLTTVSKDSMLVKIDKKGNIKKNQHKASCLTGGANSGGNHSDMDMLWSKHGCRRYTVLEAERLQTLPDGYTQNKGVSNSQCYKMLGNGWNVDTISHIFNPLKI